MRDVAAAADVDISTVAKVLSGGNIAVRPETRARIEQAAESLHYRPNASARSLRLSRTGAFGMLVPDFTNPVYAAIVRGAVREAEVRGRVMLLAELDSGHSQEVYLRLVHERRIDGLLVATARSRSPVLSLLDRDKAPHVFLNRRGTAGSLSVVVDDEEGAAVGTRALITAGHRLLGLINGPKDIDTARRRQTGFERERKALKGRVHPHAPELRGCVGDVAQSAHRDEASVAHAHEELAAVVQIGRLDRVEVLVPRAAAEMGCRRCQRQIVKVAHSADVPGLEASQLKHAGRVGGSVSAAHGGRSRTGLPLDYSPAGARR